MFFPVAEITGCGRAGSLIITPRGPSRPLEAILEMIFNSGKRVARFVSVSTINKFHQPAKMGGAQHASAMDRNLVNIFLELTVQRCTKYCAHIAKKDPGRAGKQQQEHISINLERTIKGISVHLQT